MSEGKMDMVPQPPLEFIDLGKLHEWNTEKYRIEKYGDKYSVVILGESHFDSEGRTKQIELINLIKPEFVLHEFLSGYMYDPKTAKFEVQKGRIEGKEEWELLPHYKEKLEQIFKGSHEIGFKIVGCDLTELELRRVAKELSKKFPDKYEWDEENQVLNHKKKRNDYDSFASQSREMIPARDEQINATILEYQKKSKKPIVVIMGAKHGKNIHRKKMLQQKGFGYIFVDQTSTKA